VLGANGFQFKRRALHAGRYRLIALPTDAAGNTGVPRRVGFRVVAR
jgi:hypothetical protein